MRGQGNVGMEGRRKGNWEGGTCHNDKPGPYKGRRGGWESSVHRVAGHATFALALAFVKSFAFAFAFAFVAILWV